VFRRVTRSRSASSPRRSPVDARLLENGADVIVAIGTSLGDMSTDGFSPLLQSATLVHVDIDARQIGKSYSPTHAIVASAADFLGGLADRLGERAIEAAKPRLSTGVQRFPLASSARPDRLASHDAITTIQGLLAPTRSTPSTPASTSCSRRTTSASTTRRVPRDDRPRLDGPVDRRRDRRPARVSRRSVAAIVGDGCFAMNAFEIATAVAESLPIRVFVFNDQKLGMVEDGHHTVYGRKPSYRPTPSTSASSRAASAPPRSASRPSRSSPPRRTSSRRRRARSVIDVAIDCDIHLPKIDRVAAMKNRPVSTAFACR